MTYDIDQLCSKMEQLADSHWSDGLPIVPPTRGQVDRFCAYAGRSPGDVIAKIPPLWGEGTVEKIAANAVMAGCRPEYMPVIIAALEAMTDEGLNATGMLCSMHSAIPLLIVNGPIRHALNMNSGLNVFGQGCRANATIGRAVNLVLMNIGGARPGEADRSILGHPGNYTFCIAENEEASPWEPLHVERGMAASDSAVTVIGAEAPQLCFTPGVESPWDIMTCLATHMNGLGSMTTYYQGQSLVVLSPEAAESCAKERWRKADVQQFLFERARRPHSQLKWGPAGAETGKYFMWPHWVDRRRDETMVPMARRPGDLVIVVAGGYGARCAAFLPSWATRSVTRNIAVKDEKLVQISEFGPQGRPV